MSGAPNANDSNVAPPSEVRLGYFPNVTHAQALLADASGDFQKALGETKLVTRTFNAGPSLVEALFADEIDIGYVGPSPALNAYFQSRGEGIRVVAGAACNGVVIVVGPDSGITKLEDLKGKRISTPQLGNTQDVSAKHYLTRTLGQADTTNVTPIPNAEQVAMMARGQIDAAWAVEPWGARLVAEAGGRIIAEEKDLWPEREFVLTLIVVSPEFLAEHADIVEKVLIVHREWTKRLQQDAEAQVKPVAVALEKLTSKRMDEAVISDALSRVKFTDEPLPETLQTFARWAYELKLTRHQPKIDGLVDAAILRKLQSADRTLAPPADEPAEGAGDENDAPAPAPTQQAP